MKILRYALMKEHFLLEFVWASRYTLSGELK